MPAFVVDSSVALAWCFRDETTPETSRLLDIAGTEGAAVPNLFHLETTNVLLVAERRGRMSAADTADQIALLGSLPLAIDPHTAEEAAHATLSLARIHRLTAYDAAYLELALRRRLPLATRDAALAAAAMAAGVAVLP